MCDCSTNPCGCDSGITLPYLTGAAGEDGLFGGFSAEWKFDSSSVLSNPAVNYLRFNNATLSSVTEIYLNETNIDNVNHAAFLAAFSNSSNYGLIKVWKQHESNTFLMATLTGVVDTGDHYTLTISNLMSNGTFAADDNVIISFTPQGTDGTDGSDGADGTDGVAAYVVDGIFTGTVAAGEATTLIGSIPIPANTLSTDEDMLDFSATLTRTQDADPLIDDTWLMSFGNQGYLSDTDERVMNSKYKAQSVRINGRLYRTSSTEALFTSELIYVAEDVTAGDSSRTSVLTQINEDKLTSVDFTQINLLQILALGTTQEAITLNDFVVRYTKRTS